MEKKTFLVNSTNDEQILMDLCRKLKAITIKILSKSSNADKPSDTGLGIDARGWFKVYEIGATEKVLDSLNYEFNG